MNVETMLQVLHVREHLLAVLLGLPRLLMIIQTAPFMGGTMVTGQIRIAVALACYVFIHPLLFAQVAVLTCLRRFRDLAPYSKECLPDSIAFHRTFGGAVPSTISAALHGFGMIDIGENCLWGAPVSIGICFFPGAFVFLTVFACYELCP